MELTATPIAPADALSESIDMFWNCSRVQRRRGVAAADDAEATMTTTTATGFWRVYAASSISISSGRQVG